MRRSALLLVLAACEGTPDDTAAGSVADDLGVSAHLGEARITDRAEIEGDVTWTFAPDSGPRCLRGDPYRMATRDQGASDLLIFLQGGGACWSDYCLAVTKAPAGMPAVDVLRTDLPDNPFADWNVAYLPYCDGSLFAGDRDHDDDGDGTPDRYHRGLQNLSAGLDVAADTFPAPRRVVLAGSSGGGFGTLLGASLVRHVFPEAELIVLNDSGVGVARGADEPDFVHHLLDEFGAHAFLPDDCEGCLDDGHITPLVGWYLERDPGVRVGVFSSWYDAVIGDAFLQVAPAAFRDALDAETSALHEAFPQRYRRFLIDGRMHTTLLGDPTGIIGSDLSAVELPKGFLGSLSSLEIGSLETTASGDLAVSDWIRGLVDGDLDAWSDVVEPAGPAPE